MKRYISVLLAIVFMFCSTVAFAATGEGDSIQASNYFTSYGTSLAAIGNGQVEVTFSCSAVGTASELGVANYVIQQKNSSGHWEDISGWLTGETGYNCTSYTFGILILGNPGDVYRVKCIFICTKNGSSETKSYTSGSKRAR